MRWVLPLVVVAVVPSVSSFATSGACVRRHTSQLCMADSSHVRVVGTAGPSLASDPPPEYDDSGLLDRMLLGLFRKKLAAELQYDGSDPGYAGLIEMIRSLNDGPGYPTAHDTQQAARKVLKSLFPPWLPGAFAVMFSKPFPEFSCRMNAWVTLVASQWLMGPSEINDVEIDGGQIGVGHGLLVKRCRYLEEAGCASVCVNTCKIPTQEVGTELLSFVRVGDKVNIA
eukprot:TRINITY_DN91_c0_g1_i1.p1 TRINITY_DN91_c0_g1~~TRINITY_DN91_c0_g1_i1.p1  ORF type:complete len:227 (+),score=22.85 TRINITY_DN91_c0_g1_i1:78-758(+)